MARGRLNATGGGSPLVDLDIRIEGVERTSDDFKQARREINKGLRDAQEKVGKREVLPLIKSRMSVEIGARWAAGMHVKRDRLDVVIGSRERGQRNRALGWLDFGGKRARDNRARMGPHVIVETLQSKQPAIRDAIEDAVLDEFRKAGFTIR